MTKTKPTKLQILELHRIAANGARGTCIRYQWVFQCGGLVNTQAVKTLENKGLISITYFGGGTAAVNLTDTGRAYVLTNETAA